jgi:hypothetical protein
MKEGLGLGRRSLKTWHHTEILSIICVLKYYYVLPALLSTQYFKKQQNTRKNRLNINLYELGISSFITDIDDLLRSTNSSLTDEGIITSFIDDLYWAAPFQKMIETLKL